MRIVDVYKYIINKDYEKAYGALDSISAKNVTYYKLHSAIDLKCGNYEQAYHYYVISREYIDTINRQIQSADLAELNVRFGNERMKQEAQALELKNTQLGLKNAQLELNHIKAQAELEKINTENGRLALENRNLELTRMNMESERQKTLLKEQQIAAQHHIELLSTVTGFLILLSGLMMIYFYKRRKSMRILRKKNDELTVARDRAEQSDRMKTFFIQNMSHEIRTPLNAIVGFSQILATPGMDIEEEEKLDYSERIQKNSDLLTSLVDDLLELASLESGKYTMHFQPSHCNALCRTALSTIEHRLPEGVKLAFTSDVDDNYQFTTDKKRVIQVLINLLTNAEKHTEQGEIRLHCSLSEHPGKVTFSVTDTGTGIPAEQAETIFDRFSKLDEFKQGTGLGLNICRLIAERLNGEVMLDRSYTSGARFLLVLPVAEKENKTVDYSPAAGRKLAVLLSLLLWIVPGGICAQNNPYKMDDRVFAVFQQARDSLGRPSCPALCDKAFKLAQSLGDQNGQNFSINQKAVHYSILGDLTHLRATLEEARACTTLKLSYRYVVWKQLIGNYIGAERMEEAYQEIQRMQEDAVETKSEYGIVKAYFQHAVYFQVLNNLPAAAEYYRKGFGIAGNNPYLFDPTEAVNFSSVLTTLRKYDEAVRHIRLGLSYPNIRPTQMFPLYAQLLYIYSQPPYSEDKQRAEGMKEKLDSIRAQGFRIVPSAEQLYDKAQFYYYLNVEKRADLAGRYLNSFEDSISLYAARAVLATARENYRDAYEAQTRSYECYITQQNENQSQVQKMYTLNASLEEALRERDHLQLVNTQLLLDKSREHEALLQWEAEARQSEISLNKAELSRRNSENERQSELLRHQQSELQQARENERLVQQNMRWRFGFLGAGLLVVLVCFGGNVLMHRQKEKMLRGQRDHALEVERMKSMFFQNMNHEIRTPLNAIVGFNDLLNSEEMAEVLTPDDRREYIGLIRSNADLLTTLVNDVLDLSKFESGTYLMNITAVDVRGLCHDTLESVRMRAQSGVEVVFSPGEPGLIIDTDAQRLQQVLINFLTNACKYTEQGSVTLSYACVELPETKTIDGETLPAGSYVRFAVSDTGKGVPKGEEDSCFLRFQMLDKNVKGTGLGLHICRLISKMLHGRVYVDKEYTAGARFVFDHPVKQR